MRTQKIGNMVRMALEYKERIAIAEDVWMAEEKLADYLEHVEKNLNDEEWFCFDRMFEAMKELRDAAMDFVNEAWVAIMYENRTGELHLFENGHVGSKCDVDALNMDSLYSITVDSVEWEDAAVVNEDDVKAKLEEHLEYLFEVVLDDYLERWLEHIEDVYSRG